VAQGGVPARHYAGRVQHVDSEVRESLDQKAITFIFWDGEFHSSLRPVAINDNTTKRIMFR
jgi:hypothetical protein